MDDSALRRARGRLSRRDAEDVRSAPELHLPLSHLDSSRESGGGDDRTRLRGIFFRAPTPKWALIMEETFLAGACSGKSWAVSASYGRFINGAACPFRSLVPRFSADSL